MISPERSSTAAGRCTSGKRRTLLVGKCRIGSYTPTDAHTAVPSLFREDRRQEEIRQLTSEGKIPNEVELERHPEKSIESRMCAYGELRRWFNVTEVFYRAHGQGRRSYQGYQAS